MGRAKIAITLDPGILDELDRLVDSRLFPNRSLAIEEAVREKLHRLSRGQLARECAKLDPAFEKAMAEEGMSEELGRWPEY
jgi:metal-responsive CopG/Arc/MetJ family transcriptional regulator